MPAELHPDRRELERFVAGTLAASGNRRVVRHLLAGCEDCRRLASELWRPVPQDPQAAVIRAVSRVGERQSAIEAERRMTPALLKELEGQPAARQLLLALNSRRFHNWFLCEALLKQAFEAGFSDPQEAIGLSEVAVALARRLVDSAPAEAVNQDLLARAWTVLGNARRINSELDGAEEALAEARGALELGSGDLLEEANTELNQGLLHHGRRRFRDAVQCFDRAASLCRRAGDSHLVGKALADKARTVGEEGDSERMIALLRRAVQLLDPAREPRLLLVAQHNLTWALKESGRLDEALAALQEILPLHTGSAKPMDLLRLRWLEGKLAQAQGELDRAREAFHEVHTGFVERQVPYDAALAALDLAAVFYQQDRIGEMKRLAAESLPVFRALGVHREALAALALFEEATRRERVSLRWIAELAGYLQRARSNPRLTFRPPA